MIDVLSLYFEAIKVALAEGREISLRMGVEKTNGDVMNGLISKNNSDETSLTLTTFSRDPDCTHCDCDEDGGEEDD